MFQSYFSEHLRVVERCLQDLQPSFEAMVEDIVARMKMGGKLLFFGNGGSAADAQHIATELTVRLRHNRRALPALALTTDTSALTAIGNDFGFDHIFSRQIEALGSNKDIALGISTSGSSKNVILAAEQAHQQGMLNVIFSGKDGGLLGRMSEIDHILTVASHETAHIQEVHIMLGHLLCMGIEEGLGIGKPS